MARQRSAVSNSLKKRLVSESGNKCANPGCPNLRTHVHHIREWAVYETHDGEYMIAVCPTCHDAIHHGSLPTSDQTLLAWKSLVRKGKKIKSHIYVEPAENVKIVLGSVSFTAPNEAIVFQLSDANQLRFSIKRDEILLLDVVVSSLSGRELLRVVDNHITHDPAPPLHYAQVPGHFRVTAPADPDFVPPWAIEKMRLHVPTFATEEVTLVEMEVIRPGVVRVQGIWADAERAVIVTKEALTFVGPRVGPITIQGAGEETVFKWAGPVTHAMFGFGRGSSSPQFPLSRP